VWLQAGKTKGDRCRDESSTDSGSKRPDQASLCKSHPRGSE